MSMQAVVVTGEYPYKLQEHLTKWLTEHPLSKIAFVCQSQIGDEFAVTMLYTE